MRYLASICFSIYLYLCVWISPIRTARQSSGEGSLLSGAQAVPGELSSEFQFKLVRFSQFVSVLWLRVICEPQSYVGGVSYSISVITGLSSTTP